jgi:probable phosphoglycerate mutase
MDSKLVVEQMSGRWQIKNPGLRPLAAEAAKLVAGFASVTFDWIPRERNKLADALANRAMDEAAGKPVPRHSGSATEPKAPRNWAPPSLDTATRLILVRHGETAMTAQGRYPAAATSRSPSRARPRRWPRPGGWRASPATSRRSSPRPAAGVRAPPS